MTKSPYLSDLLHDRYVPDRPGLTDRTIAYYATCIRNFERFLGRPARLSDLSRDAIQAFVSHRAAIRSPKTVNHDRTTLIVFWRWAWDRELTRRAPRLIRKLREPKRIPFAWRIEQVEKILAVTTVLQGEMRGTGISKRDWWTSLILFLLDVGCRKESALLLRPEEIDLDACTARLRWENDKTSIESWRRFSGQTADWVRSHYSLTRARVWPYPYHRRQVWIQFKRILKAANLPHDRYRMFHCFRRTNATYATANGSLELARQQMGHTSLEMTLRYVDPRLLNGQQAVDVLPRPKLPRKN